MYYICPVKGRSPTRTMSYKNYVIHLHGKCMTDVRNHTMNVKNL